MASEEYTAHTNPLFFQFKILKIDDIYTYNVALFAYKSHQNFILGTFLHNYLTRTRNSAVAEFHRLNSSQRSLSYVAPNVWNGLGPDTKNSSSIHVFKKRMKGNLIAKYSMTQS